MRSSASSLAPWKNYANDFFLLTFIDCKMLAANGLSSDSTSSGLGLPNNSRTRSI